MVVMSQKNQPVSVPGKVASTPPREFDLLNDNIQDFLPPLEALIDSAIANDPLVGFRRKQIDVNTYKLKNDQRQWMRDIGFQLDIRYGNFDNWSTNAAEGETAANFYTTRVETKYGAGAYIKFPLYDLINRNNVNGLAKMEISQAHDMYRMQQEELRQKVITQFNDLLLKQKLLVIKSKFLETTKVNMLMTEKEFLNGNINISEYSRLSSIAFSAEEDFEQLKSEFKTAYMILEEIVGIKLRILTEN
jgi:outer membrane protein TolC